MILPRPLLDCRSSHLNGGLAGGNARRGAVGSCGVLFGWTGGIFLWGVSRVGRRFLILTAFKAFICAETGVVGQGRGQPLPAP